MDRVAVRKVVERVRWEQDPAIIRIVNSWPGNFDSRRGNAMGLKRDTDFESIVRASVEDELKGKLDQ